MSNEHKIFGVVTVVFIIAMFLGWNKNRSDKVLIRSGKCREIRFSELTNACFDSKKIKSLKRSIKGIEESIENSSKHNKLYRFSPFLFCSSLADELLQEDINYCRTEFCGGNDCGPHSSRWASCNLAPIGSKAKKLCDKYQ